MKRTKRVALPGRSGALAIITAIALYAAGTAASDGEPALRDEAQATASGDVTLNATALQQIGTLMAEKSARTPAQRKIDSQLLFALQARTGRLAQGMQALASNVLTDKSGRTTVDIVCNDVRAARGKLEQANAVVLDVAINTIRAYVPLSNLETIAAWPSVRFISPQHKPRFSRNISPGKAPPDKSVRTWLKEVLPQLAAQDDSAATAANAVKPMSVGDNATEGDRTHLAHQARHTYGLDGAGVKIGVISDGVDWAQHQQAAGDLPAFTILPGQAGVGREGAAMLEIIHDLAPRAQLYFATAFGSAARFAQNIRDLRAAGCDIIVDDVGYTAESPFQDGQGSNVLSTTDGGIVTQAVNDVTADGALYFSSAGNGGNLSDGTATVYEGDFADGGSIALLPGGTVHAFAAGITTNQIKSAAGGAVQLFWSDPMGGSANDYDLFVLDSTGTRIVGASTNIQDGTQDPYELAFGGVSYGRVVILKHTGAQKRFLHLDGLGQQLERATSGQVYGHSIAKQAFSVAATPATTGLGADNPNGPYPNAFSATNVVEPFSSDGRRRIFFKADGTSYTPGNVSSTGGVLRQKPDITAADGVTCGTPGFEQFFGTSAASPHAAAIAALLKSALPGIEPAQVRQALTTSAIDIEASGVDRDSGAGIIMAPAALQAAGAKPGPLLRYTGGRILAESCRNNRIDAGETLTMSLCLRNFDGVAAQNVSAELVAGGGVERPSARQSFGRLAVGSPDVCRPFTFKVAKNCGDLFEPTLRVWDGGRELPRQSAQYLVGTPVFQIVEFFQNVKPPQLPSGWTTTFLGTGEPFETSFDLTGFPAAFARVQETSGESSLISPPIKVTSALARMLFVHELMIGGGSGIGDDGVLSDDGAVLEIKIGGGDFQDIIAAGGRFLHDGYNTTLAPRPTPDGGTCGNPLGAFRRAWAGDSEGPVSVEIDLPASANGQIVQFRWRVGSDCAFTMPGAHWIIDQVQVMGGYECCSASNAQRNPVPSSGALTSGVPFNVRPRETMKK